MRVSIISLFLLLALLSPIESEEAAKEDGGYPEILEMLSTIEDGGYDKETSWVDYDYSPEAGIDNVLDADLSFLRRNTDRDYPLDYEETEQKVLNHHENIFASQDVDKDFEVDVLIDEIEKKDVTDRVYDYDESSEISETIVGNDGFLDIKEEILLGEYQDVDYLEEEAKMMKVTMDDLYDQSMIFHIILLLGICLICVVVFFGLVTLAVTVLTRRQDPSSSSSSSSTVRTVKVKADGIVKSYAKIPVEIKNMVPSNIAYKQLYEV